MSYPAYTAADGATRRSLANMMAMTADPVEERLEYLEVVAAEASTVPQRLDAAREAITLIQSILHDLTKDLENADEYADDLDRIDQLAALMLS